MREIKIILLRIAKNNVIDRYASEPRHKAKNVRVVSFIKAHQINGYKWDSDKQVFYGLKVSLFFYIYKIIIVVANFKRSYVFKNKVRVRFSIN
jgi:hypothetical protein